MADANDDAVRGRTAVPAQIVLTTDHVMGAGADPLEAALRSVGVAVERQTFLPVRPDEYTRGVLLLSTSGPPLPLAQLVAPATAPPGVVPALVAALGTAPRPAFATLQLKAAHVFVSIWVRQEVDIMRVLDDLPVHLMHLGPSVGERRLVYGEDAWSVDP